MSDKHLSDKQENEGAEVFQTESRTVDVPPTKSRKRGFLGHLKRFWWAYLLLFICGAVLVICLV